MSYIRLKYTFEYDGEIMVNSHTINPVYKSCTLEDEYYYDVELNDENLEKLSKILEPETMKEIEEFNKLWDDEFVLTNEDDIECVKDIFCKKAYKEFMAGLEN